ncbi:MAG: hypothetical protein RLN88_07790 [Ekhidna sp.]|uniref:hypothetical protein n=1 Tax=Ekhidna sp. TaxID=2608089 RepID=UPI0032EFA7F8
MINDRIYRLIRVLDMNPTSFSDSLEVSVTVIFNIIKGRRSKPSFDLILNILKTYDKLNAEWLIKGEGPMWNDDIVTSAEIAPSHVNLQARIRELFVKMRLQRPDSHEVMELEELVNYLIEESTEEKNKLILLHERQEGMLKVLKDKLKLKI